MTRSTGHGITAAALDNQETAPRQGARPADHLSRHPAWGIAVGALCVSASAVLLGLAGSRDNRCAGRAPCPGAVS